MDAVHNLLHDPFGIGAVVISYLRDHGLDHPAEWFAIRYGFPPEISQNDEALHEIVVRWLYTSGFTGPATVLSDVVGKEDVITNIHIEEGVDGLNGNGIVGEGLL